MFQVFFSGFFHDHWLPLVYNNKTRFFFSFFFPSIIVRLNYRIWFTHTYTSTQWTLKVKPIVIRLLFDDLYMCGDYGMMLCCVRERERKKGKRIRWLSMNTIDNRYEYISATPQNNNELITIKFTHFFSLSFGADFLFCFSLAWSCYTSYLFIRLMIIDWVIGSLIFFLLLFFCL